jgi:SAM-dependent methyltransferase
VNFRKRDNDKASQAYREMEIGEFEGINARQAWTNWRTVARNLNGRLDEKPLKAIDLCCGVGQSTEVLACYLPSGSKILGIDQAPELVKEASQRAYYDRNGVAVEVHFRAQSALETFHDHEGKIIADESLDLANSCGAIGHHFTHDMTLLMMREIARVLKPGGLALIDSGPWGTRPNQVRQIAAALGWKEMSCHRSIFLDPLFQIAFQKAEHFDS